MKNNREKLDFGVYGHVIVESFPDSDLQIYAKNPSSDEGQGHEDDGGSGGMAYYIKELEEAT